MNAEIEKRVKQIRQIAEKAERPLYFFDDDPDGACSFLLFYRFIKDGKGIIIKQSELTGDFVRKVDEYNPDVIFILDVPNISRSFLDNVKQTKVWIDHHPPNEEYFGDAVCLNPKRLGIEDNYPTSYWAYKIVNQDVWLGALGVIADWVLPDFFDDFAQQYASLVPKRYNSVEDYRFNGDLSILVKIFTFNVKGSSREAMKSLKILTRIDDPQEILKHETPRAKFLYRKYERFSKEFDTLVSSVKIPKEDEFIVFTYTAKNTSFSAELSNYFNYKFPEKIIVMGREKSGEVRCSIRSQKYDVRSVLMKVLEGFKDFGASGGGHTHACGFNIKKKYFKAFISMLRLGFKV